MYAGGEMYHHVIVVLAITYPAVYPYAKQKMPAVSKWIDCRGSLDMVQKRGKPISAWIRTLICSQAL
jgi:hypothetical protein